MAVSRQRGLTEQAAERRLLRLPSNRNELTEIADRETKDQRAYRGFLAGRLPPRVGRFSRAWTGPVRMSLLTLCGLGPACENSGLVREHPPVARQGVVLLGERAASVAVGEFEGGVDRRGPALARERAGGVGARFLREEVE